MDTDNNILAKNAHAQTWTPNSTAQITALVFADGVSNVVVISVGHGCRLHLWCLTAGAGTVCP